MLQRLQLYLCAHRKSNGKTLTNGGSSAGSTAAAAAELPLSCSSLRQPASQLQRGSCSSSSKRRSAAEVAGSRTAAASAKSEYSNRKTENLLVSLDDGNGIADFSEDSIDSGKQK